LANVPVKSNDIAFISFVTAAAAAAGIARKE